MRDTRKPVPIPDDSQISLAMTTPAKGLVAVAGTRKEQLIFLNIAYRNGDIETVYLDDNGAARLIAALKALAPTSAGIAASRPILGGDGSIEVQEGFLPDIEDDD